jgi:two-component system, sensor histidine kinase
MPSEKSVDTALATVVGEQGMKAQAALLPFALLAFGVSLPIFVWVAGHAANAHWMSAAFAAFAVGWGAFYGVVNWLKTPAATDLRRRARVQILAGLIWALAIAGLAAFAHFAGPVRETLLLLILAAAMVCVVFTATWLPSLLIVAPVAVAGPLMALFLDPADQPTARLALGAAALGLALALAVNRILRRQYALAAERELLLAERAEQAEAARRFARVKSDLVDSLSDELRDGLTGVAHVLAAAARGRAAPTRQQIGVALDSVNELLNIVGEGAAAPADEPGRRLRILTVEPDPLTAATLRASLEQLGHQVVHTTQAARAVELARICELDLAVCGDPAAIAPLRALPGGAGATPIVAIVGAEIGEAEAALGQGADALVRRPLALPAIARAIADALSATQAANDRQVA